MNRKRRQFSTLLASFLFVLATAVYAADKPKIQTINNGDSLETMREIIAQNGWSFTVGHNKIYDMTTAQKAVLLKKRWVPKSKRVRINFSNTTLAKKLGKKATPSSLDWRNYNGHAYIGSPRDQGNCGSCYSFGACAAAEGTYNFATGKYDADVVDFSESYIAWCLGSLDGYSNHFSGCDGADYEYYELKALTKEGLYEQYDGAALEADCPYSESPLIPSDYLGRVNTVVFKEWDRVYPANFDDTTAAIKTAIMTYGVVDAAVYVDDPFMAYTSGVYEDTNTTPSEDPYYYETTNHAIALVGWDDNPTEGGGGCWILRNSWGDSWGEDGYMRIRFKSAAVNCAVCYLAYEADSGDDDDDDDDDTPTEPLIGISSGLCTFSCERGSAAEDQSFTIYNAGVGILNYTISCESGMVSCSPTSGTLSNSTDAEGNTYYGKDTITVTANSANYPIGTYSCKLIISDPHAINSPQEVQISLTVTGATYAVGNGSQFMVKAQSSGTGFTAKPKVYVKSGTKDLKMKVMTNHYPSGGVYCELARKVVPGLFHLYLCGRGRDDVEELVSDSFTVKGPEITGMTNTSAMTISGNYFGEKRLKVYLNYQDSRTKRYRKLRLKVATNSFDPESGASVLTIKSNKKLRLISEGTLVVENPYGSDSVPYKQE